MKLISPVRDVYVTQPFGVNYVGFYEKLGLNGHNGVDYRARNGCPIYASHYGEVIYAGKDTTGGIGVQILGDGFKTFYYHNKKNLVKVGKKVKAGDLIAEADNTGKYTTAYHLHFGLYRTDTKGNRTEYNNGYKGAIDPTPYFPKNWDKTNAYHRYGRKQEWLAEFKMRFKNIWLHKQLIARGRHPLSLTTDECNALVYGGWDFEAIMNPSMWENWAYVKKDEYTRGRRPFN